MPSKEQPCIVGNQTPRQTNPGRAREGVNLLDFQSRPTTCASERLLALWASKSLCDRPSEIEDFGWSPRVLIFSERGAWPPGEKIASLQIPRPEIRRISAESEKGWCGGESVPSASGCAREGRSPLDFQSKGFPQEILSFSEGVAVAGELAPSSTSRACSPVHTRIA